MGECWASPVTSSQVWFKLEENRVVCCQTLIRRFIVPRDLQLVHP
jgi:hypothetical protein